MEQVRRTLSALDKVDPGEPVATVDRVSEESRAASDGAIDAELSQQVLTEFLEMPGLTLTFRQAMRLWQLDSRSCRAVLEGLVGSGFLTRTRHGAFRRISG